MTLQSMTGFGHARAERDGVRVDAELRSVNNRFLAVRCRAPHDLSAFEAKVEAAVRRRLARGMVDVSLRVRRDAPGATPRVNDGVVAAYRDALARLRAPGEAAPATLALLGLPGVVTLDEADAVPAALERCAGAALGDALEALAQARLAEGARIGKALRRELAGLRRDAAALQRSVPRLVKRHQGALRMRLGRLLDGVAIPQDDPALMREIALLADRLDVTEELDRLGSHCDAFAQTLDQGGPAGRQLEFLLQEIGREINTLGAKVNDGDATRRVVAMKGRVERLREQVVNVE